MTPPPARPAAIQVQIFGFEKDRPTRAAVRFFKERRVEIHQVDLRRKPLAAGELRRFVQHIGAAALLDTESKGYREGGLAYLAMDEPGIVGRLLADPALLRLPLVRFREEVTAGPAEATWRSWITSSGAAPSR